MSHTILLLLMTLATLTAKAQTQLTTSEANTYFTTTSKARVSVHDPSVVYEPTSRRYYIFGSHKVGAYTSDFQNWTMANPTWGTANSNNAANADAFTTPAVKTVMKNGYSINFPVFNAADWSGRSDSSYNIDGNMWAPDVVYNPTMGKWCYYLSVNGDGWHSSIILLTADHITGPYTYQGPVVICGFHDSDHSYKGTDLEIVTGTQLTLPSRYNVGSKWGDRWPHTIDPAVFYDHEGKLWLTYGSWSGGIWMLELDESTGLRDYNVSYPSVNGSTNQVSSDPYFGKKIAGGVYVSGEGPYIERIGQYYYLFVSYGFYSPDGGYEMRVFRSENPDGPYTDQNGVSAIFTSYVMNYGKRGDTRGEKIMGAYNNWGNMTVGECAQGHNSIIAAGDGRTYLVYHTKFNNGTIGHQVRVHQVFQNKKGWLVAAPFEYNGETTTDATIATTQPFTTEQIAGNYQLLIHRYGMDYAAYEEVTPIEVTLTVDGRVTGGASGTWAIDEGTGYFAVTINGTTYDGVIAEETMDGQNVLAIAFTACSGAGNNVWGYKLHPKCALAWQVINQSLPLREGQVVSRDIDLYGNSTPTDGVTLTWTSSRPDVISNQGKYNPMGLAENTPVTLTARLESPGYFWEQSYRVTALSEQSAEPTADWKTGMIAHYGFDDDALANTFDAMQHAQLMHGGSTATPVLGDDEPLRTGRYTHLFFGVNGSESYVEIPNPLLGKDLEEGATISFWLKRSDNNLWDAILGFVEGNARFYMTGNAYMGYNDGNTTGTNNWLDICHPTSLETGLLTPQKWVHVTMVVARNGISLFVNGTRKALTKWNGMLNGNGITTASGFDYNLIVDHLTRASELYLGRGSFWGSADIRLDDFIVYDRPLSYAEVVGLYDMNSRVFDFSLVREERDARAYLTEWLSQASKWLAVPHVENAEGTDAALHATIDAIAQQLDGATLTQVLALADEATEATAQFIGHATATDPEQPFDITLLLKNPGMDSTEGWTGSPTLHFSCGEFYQQLFDFYQTVGGLPAATYQFAVNAFQRPGKPEECAGRPVAALIYAGDKSTSLCHVTKEAQSKRLGGNESFVDGKYFPNDMEAASIYFAKDLYDNRVTVASSGGNLRVGIRGTTMDSYYWCIFDHFRLYCHGGLDANIVERFKYTLGDVNCDGAVSIADVMCVIQRMLGGKPIPFCERAGDINGDAEITISDVALIVSILVNGNF